MISLSTFNKSGIIFWPSQIEPNLIPSPLNKPPSSIIHLQTNASLHLPKQIMKTLENPIPINPSSFFFFFTLFPFVEHCFCLDPSYEACVPKDCGDVFNISYPFFIKGLQNPFCGYPGFELNCSNDGTGAPVLRISGSDFIVRHIHYENRSIRLLNAVIWPNTTQSCPSAIRNITVNPNQFEIASTKNIVFLPNCSQLPPNLERYRIGSCQSGRELVMLENDKNLPNETEFCNRDGGVVEAPVELRGMSDVVDGGNYVEVMRRGFLMRWLAADCAVCKGSGGRCGFNTTAFQFRCFCPDRPHKVRCKPARRKHKLVIIGVVAGSVLLVAVATAVFVIRVAHKRNFLSYFSTRDKSRDVEDGSVYFGVLVFSYTELEDATHNFDESHELGDGGFGTVYFGKLRDGREVAVKRLYEHNYKRVQQFMNEVEILTRLRHQNLVSLYGCTSRRSRELLLVYEYIPNGTVADHLHGDGAKVSPLTWPIRMKIAIETASALVYLHASEIIHRDVKTNNILLDHNFCVKVADFGLSRLLPNDVTHVSTAPQGTPGYVDPEYHQCYQLTDKSDVYSFGVVLIELISSMPAIDITRSRDEISLANMAINRIQRCALDELIDPLLGSDPETEKMTTSVAELAFRCLQFDSESRPTMNEVLEVLKGIQREENTEDVDNVGELQNVKQQLPPPSPESENVGLLKDLTTSPISVTVKWHSTSSGSITPSTSVRD